jgi:hypothetical protein
MKKQIISQATGGLGNQLFQYAFAKELSRIYNLPFKLDLSFFDYYELHEYSLDPFTIEKDYTTREEIAELNEKDTGNNLFSSLFKRKIHRYEEQKFSYSDHYLKGLSFPLYLKGYWQSEKYFKHVEQEIRADFKVLTPPSEENKHVLDQIKKTNSIFLHVRRGNYVTDQETLKFHGSCSKAYYTSAVKCFQEVVDNPVFYIFSNDIPWSREHMDFDVEKVFVDLNDDSKDYEDFRLMYSCKHAIIANSTFSWWAAYLIENATKQIIAPKQWFANEEMQAQTGDLLPESWLKM